MPENASDLDFTDPKTTLKIAEALISLNPRNEDETDEAWKKRFGRWMKSLTNNIRSAKTSNVEGSAYTFKFYLTDGRSCSLSWFEEPWMPLHPEHVHFGCVI